MTTQINITINHQPYIGTQGQTILDVANQNNIPIPTMCHSPGLPPSGSCGICVVAVAGFPRLLRACATPITPGMDITTESEKLTRTRRGVLELSLSTHTGDCLAPCKLACPAESACKEYIQHIAQGNTLEAVRIMKEAHPFPASIARICPRPCEANCRRGLIDQPVNIAGLKGYAADLHLNDTNINITGLPTCQPDTGKKVAIVGGGPAGLTAAFFVRRMGHQVVVFEKQNKMGGLLQYGIPEYRLPKNILDQEINALQAMGIIFENNRALGDNLDLPQLQADYDSVIIATGATKSKPLWVPGEDAQGVIGGVDFLKQVADGQIKPGTYQNVLVVGGSNTAMDAARTALRLGATNVSVSYRRTVEEMPAEPIEIEEAKTEGVNFLFLTAPHEVAVENNQAQGLYLQQMALGEPDASGRRSPAPTDAPPALHKADLIIAAIGQDVEIINPLTSLAVDDNFETNLPKVFAIGDATGKSAYAIDAIAHGRKVAETVVQSLAKPNWQTVPAIIVKDHKCKEDFLSTRPAPRENETSHVSPANLTFKPSHTGLTHQAAINEATRCLKCGCDGFDKCQLLKLSNTYLAKVDKFEAGKKPKHHIDDRNQAVVRDMNKCVHCYLCINTCNNVPNHGQLLSATTRGFDAVVDTAFGQKLPDSCKNCGQCANVCPTGALISGADL